MGGLEYSEVEAPLPQPVIQKHVSKQRSPLLSHVCKSHVCKQLSHVCKQRSQLLPNSLYRYVCLQAPFTIQMHLSAGTWMPAVLHVSEMPALLHIPRSYTHTPHLLTCHHSSTSPTAYLVVSLLNMRQCREMWLCGEMPDVVRWLMW